MKHFAILTAGGTGTRMNAEIPKQFLKLGNLPILMHTVNRFHQFDNQITIILSLPENYIEYWKNLCAEYHFTIKHHIVKGGKTRFHSIKNTLEIINESGFVAVHDAVRPLVSLETLKRTFQTAEKKGNAVASYDIIYSLRKVEKDFNFAVNRSLYKEIQTPQTFDIEKLKEAYHLAYREEFTDDASVFEAAGNTINLVQGNPENIKITSPEDLIIAEALLNRIF